MDYLYFDLTIFLVEGGIRTHLSMISQGSASNQESLHGIPTLVKRQTFRAVGTREHPIF